VNNYTLAGILMASAVSAVASGQDTALPATASPLPLECFSGPLKPGFVSRSSVTLYDNSNPELTSNSANPRQILDDVQLSPGPADTVVFPALVNGINLAFTLQSLGNFDLEVTVYDTINLNAGTGSAVNDAPPVSTFTIPLRNIPNTGGWQTGLVDLSSLPGGGITLQRKSTFIRVRFLQPGTTAFATNATPLFASSWDVSSNWESTRSAGRSCSGSFRDVNGDGVLSPSEFRNFNFPGQADLFLVLQASVQSSRCPADFNNDGAVDFFDYLDFVDAFSVGCT
jgi:hypothetical protein